MPTSLLRFGLTDYLELRFNFAHLRLSEPINNTYIRGFGDYEAGMKIQIFDDEDINVKIAFLSHLLLPIGNDLLKTENFGVINRIAFSHKLSDVFDLSYNIGYNQLSSKINQLTYSLALAYEYNPSVSFYVEPYGEYVNSVQLQTYFNVGMTYLVNNNFQLDLSYGASYGKMRLFKMNYIAAGISFRI